MAVDFCLHLYCHLSAIRDAWEYEDYEAFWYINSTLTSCRPATYIKLWDVAVSGRRYGSRDKRIIAPRSSQSAALDDESHFLPHYSVSVCVCQLDVCWSDFFLNLCEIISHPHIHVCTVVVCVLVIKVLCTVRVCEVDGVGVSRMSLHAGWHTFSAVTMLTRLGARSRSLFPSYKPGSRTQAVKEYVDLTNTCVKPWSSMQVRPFIFSWVFIFTCSSLSEFLCSSLCWILF